MKSESNKLQESKLFRASKKNMLLPLLLAFFISCQKQPDVIKTTEKKDTKQIEKKNISCSDYLLVIDRADVPENWLANNERYLCVDLTNDCYFVVDLENITSTSDRDRWVEANEKYINFKRSYKYIENVHRIKEDSELFNAIRTQNENIEYFSMNIYDFKKKLLDIGVDYDKEMYRHYIQFELRRILFYSWISFGNVTYNDTTFSLPFFRAIENCNNLQGNFEMQFAKITLDDGDEDPNNDITKMFIRVPNPEVDGGFAYYDYSQIPHPIWGL